MTKPRLLFGENAVRKIPEDTMTARERVLATINGEQADRVPIFDLIQHKELMEHVTGEKVTLENGMDLLLATIRECLDTTRGIAPPVEEQTWRDDEGFVYRTEWWTNWIIERPFKDTKGVCDYIRRNMDAVRASDPYSLWTFYGNANVWIKSDADPNEQYRQLQERLENVVLFPTESPVGLDTAYHRVGLDLFCYAYADEPELVSEWLEVLLEHEIERVHRTADAELAPVALVYSDMADQHAPLFSPQFLRREMFPRLTRLVDAWHSHGVKVIWHSDGDFISILDDFKVAGVDGVNPLEPLEGTDHIKAVRDGWPEFAIMGGIDCSNLLAYGTKEEVEAAVKHALDVTRPGGKYLLGSSTELHPACKLENILRMWDVALSYGRF